MVPVVGWLVGVALLCASPRWRTRDKLLGTLVWPGGLLAPAGLILIAGAGVTASSSECGPGPVLSGTPNAPAGPPAHDGSVGTVAHDGRFPAHRVISASACTPSAAGLPSWLIIAINTILLAAAVAGPVFTAVRLLRRARQAPHELAADPVAFQPT